MKCMYLKSDCLSLEPSFLFLLAKRPWGGHTCCGHLAVEKTCHHLVVWNNYVIRSHSFMDQKFGQGSAGKLWKPKEKGEAEDEMFR